MCVIVKTRYFYRFTINSQSKVKKIQHTILETFAKKTQLEIFTTAFLLKTII